LELFRSHFRRRFVPASPPFRYRFAGKKRRRRLSARF
jgi:hypothetical protein